MFEQFTKAFEAAGAGPLVHAAMESAKKTQACAAKALSDGTEFAQLEIGHAMSLAQSRKPEEAIAALAKAAEARQEYVSRKAKEAQQEWSAFGAEWAKMFESKGAELSERAAGAVDAAFATAKHGLGFAETAVKSAVAKTAAKTRKG